jgi:hypothetical protein
MSLSQPARWRHRALELRPASRRFSSKDGESLEAQIAAQGMRVREMKEALKRTGAPHNGDSDALKTEIDKLKVLKQKGPPAGHATRGAGAMDEAARKGGVPHSSDALKTEIDKLKDLKEKRAPAERSVRIAKAEKFREKGINPYAYTWEVTDSCTALQVAHKGLGNGEVAEGAKTSIAGLPVHVHVQILTIILSHTCIYACTPVCVQHALRCASSTHAHTHTHTHTCTHACTHARMHARTHARTHAQRAHTQTLALMCAGRIMGKRVFGKLAFYTLADSEGEIQLYLEQDAIKAAGGDESFEDLKVSFVHCIKSLHVHIRSLLTR